MEGMTKKDTQRLLAGLPKSMSEREGKDNGEQAPPTLGAFHLYSSPVGLGEGLADRQAQA